MHFITDRWLPILSCDMLAMNVELGSQITWNISPQSPFSFQWSNEKIIDFLLWCIKFYIHVYKTIIYVIGPDFSIYVNKFRLPLSAVMPRHKLSFLVPSSTLCVIHIFYYNDWPLSDFVEKLGLLIISEGLFNYAYSVSAITLKALNVL